MQKLLKKDVTFYWDEECQHSLNVFKAKMVIAPILVFSDWKKEFHVHSDALCIALREILTYAGEWEIDHIIAFGSRKLSKDENNYSTKKREGLATVYALQKSRHYLLHRHFKMYMDHSALNYLVNKPVLGGRICIW